MAYYYADGRAVNDSGPGTLASPKKLAQSAYNLASAGDTVSLQVASVYAEELTINRAGSAATPITVEAYSEAAGDLRGTNTRATITPDSIAGTGAVNITAAYNILRNINVEHAVNDKHAIYINGVDRGALINCRGKASNYSGLYINNANFWHFDNILVEQCGGTGIYPIRNGCSYSVWTNCTVRDTLAGSPAAWYMAGYNNTYLFCRVLHCAGDGIRMDTDPLASLLFCDISDNASFGLNLKTGLARVFGCNIAFNGDWGVNNYPGTGRMVLLHGNIISGNANGQIAASLVMADTGNDLVSNPYVDATYAARAANNWRLSAAARSVAMLRGDGLTQYADRGAVQTLVRAASMISGGRQ